MCRVLGDLSLAVMDTEIDAGRIAALGLAGEPIRAYGGGYDLGALVKEVGNHLLAVERRGIRTFRLVRVALPPGGRLYAWARFFFSKIKVELIVEPLISN
jgi:hypothetical protein